MTSMLYVISCHMTNSMLYVYMSSIGRESAPPVPWQACGK